MKRIIELSAEEEVVRSYMERAIDGSSSSLVGLKLLHRFSSETPEAFSNAALTLLDSGYEPSPQRFMTVLLLKQPQLFRVLSDPARMDKPASIWLFRRLLVFDHSLDLRLAKCLPNRLGVSDLPLPVPSCLRALEVLDEVSEGRRLVAILGHLVEHPIPSISAKAALLIGKRVQSVNWTKRLLSQQQDPRNRANALEALWGLDDRETRTLLWECASDPHNRVAGNAVFGLHLIGEEKAVALVQRMAYRKEPPFRWTSAWLMSKIALAEFVKELKLMIKDDNPGVRRAAFKALVEIRREELQKKVVEEKLVVSSSEQQAQPEALNDSNDTNDARDHGQERITAPSFDLRLDGQAFSSSGL